MTMQGLPTISVIIIPLVGKSALFWCLKALLSQDYEGDIEIIVPYDDTLADISSLTADYPGVKFLRQEGRHTPAELRALGVRESQGQLVAITEDHCQPEFGWCAGIARHHQEDHPAIGGPVEKTGVDSALNWAVYFADYLRYALPFGDGPAPSLTDLNVSYKRTDLDGIRQLWENEFHEPVVHSALTSNGKPLWISPDILVAQRRVFSWRSALHDRYAFGRLFGSTRVQGVSIVRRMMMALLALLVPVILVVRVALHIYRKRRFIDQFVFSFPALVMISLAWGWGELLGYLSGRPDRSLQASGQG